MMKKSVIALFLLIIGAFVLWYGYQEYKKYTTLDLRTEQIVAAYD